MAAQSSSPTLPTSGGNRYTVDLPGVGFVYPRDIKHELQKLYGDLNRPIPSSNKLIYCYNGNSEHIAKLIDDDLETTTGRYPHRYRLSSSKSSSDKTRQKRHISGDRAVFP